MQLIKNWQDVAPFAGKFVAYEVEGERPQFPWFGVAKKCPTLPGGGEVLFGVVSRDSSEYDLRPAHNYSVRPLPHETAKGFALHAVIAPDDVSHTRELLQKDLDRLTFRIREATPEEIQGIKQAVAAKEALITYTPSWLDMSIKTPDPADVTVKNGGHTKNALHR